MQTAEVKASEKLSQMENEFKIALDSMESEKEQSHTDLQRLTQDYQNLKNGEPGLKNESIEKCWQNQEVVSSLVTEEKMIMVLNRLEVSYHIISNMQFSSALRVVLTKK